MRAAGAARKPASKRTVKRQRLGLPSIQWRLMAAFLLVAGMSVGSAAVAWLFVHDSTARLESVVEEDLGSATAAQALASDVEAFAAMTRRFTHVRTDWERSELVATLNIQLAAMSRRIDRLEELGFDSISIAALRSRIDGLSVNLDVESQLSVASIAAGDELAEAVSVLQDEHRAFIEMAEPRIEAGYRAFIDQGNRIIAELIQLDGPVQVGDFVADTISRVGLDTLVNGLAGTMRADLEALAATHLVVGLLNEGANAPDVDRVYELRAQFATVRESMRRLRLDFDPAGDQGLPMLDQAETILGFGEDPGGIFQLRLHQLGSETVLSAVAGHSQQLAGDLGRQVDMLLERASETVTVASDDLADRLSRALAIQTIAAALAVAVALLVGWRYVGRRVMGRLQVLRSAMESHAQGQDAPIPVDGADEIGDMARALTSFVDQRRHAEIALRQAKFEAEQANKAKSTFLAAMSHELRTPLNAVLGFSEMIRDRYYGPLGDVRYSEYAGDIFASGSYLLDLINDILDIAKIEAGKLVISPEPTDLRDLISAALRLVGERAERARISLETEVSDRIPILLADPRAIKQVLFNLLANAIKFTEPGGRVTVGATYDVDRSFVDLTVSDTGCGIPPDKVSLVFRPFERADNSFDASAEKGTGLGLPLAKGLVELHGGEITLNSTLDVGTTVTMRLPLTVCVQDAHQQSDPPDIAHALQGLSTAVGGD